VIASPCRAPCLRFDTCTTAPETWLLPAALRAHPPATSTDCPAASDGEGVRFPGPSSGGRSATVLPQSRSPVAPSPSRFGHATARCVDRSMGSRCRPGTASASSRQSPLPPLRAPTSDHAGNRYVLGRNRESRSRPRNCDSRCGNAITWELTSLLLTNLLSVLCTLGLKTPIHAHKIGVWGDMNIKLGVTSTEPPKGTSLGRKQSYDA